MTTVEILTMPVPIQLASERHGAWLAAFRAFDLDPQRIAAVKHARVPTITLELDGTVTLECDVFVLDDAGKHTLDDNNQAAVERRTVTRPATVVAHALDGVA